ncbi:hypothetical protein H2200_011709 [Cladophialophora chaetospira]|uniref:Uncharacterized protein n=1 Tax=Cladophialophora chaetospira TaxID=386627 RepID=A0AA38WYN3_9EURO|nr:hypothetical protein H2200_011709 [Cladophialophora chaetospira]
MSSSHKRMHSDVPDEPSKRQAPQSAPEAQRSPEWILEYISIVDLRDFSRKLLAHPAAGPIARQELVAYKGRALVNARATVKKECDVIIDASYAAGEKALSQALWNKGNESLDLWPKSLEHLLPRIQALIDRGTLLGGPGLAWQALVEIVDASIYEWDGGEAEVVSDEEDCDWFHEKVDDLMLQIFQVQYQNIPEWFEDPDGVVDPRMVIREWQQRATRVSGPCTYRYQRTLQFLETVETLPKEVQQADGGRRPGKSSRADESDSESNSESSSN